MPNNYQAPFEISKERAPQLPDTGTFTVPVCTTRERYQKMTNALFFYGVGQGDDADFDHLVDWLNALPNIVMGCVEFEDQCRTIALNDERLQWFPENPYTPDEEIPDGYPAHPFTVASTDSIGGIIIAWGLGYKAGDIFVDITKLPVFTDWGDFLENYNNMPSVLVNGLEGTGTVKAEVLSIPFGGRIVVIVDDVIDLLNLQAVELDRDATFPPESIVSLTIETKITTAGAHNVRYVWYPAVGAELPPVSFGGGIRSFEICGFGDSMSVDDCCDDLIAGSDATNALLKEIRDLIKNGFYVKPFEGISIPPDEFAGGCAPDHYDSDTGDEGDDVAKRSDALCFVVESYITTLLYKSLVQMGLPIPSPIAFFPILEIQPAALQNVAVFYPSPFNLIALFEALISIGGAIDELTCEMVGNLSAKLNTYDMFKKSLALVSGEDAISALRGLVWTSNQVKANWEVFNEALEQAMDMDFSAYECPCAPEVPFELIDPAHPEFHNTTIEYLGENQWHVTQTTEYPTGVYSVNLQDSLCRQINIVATGAQTIDEYFSRGADCDTITDSGTGGFGGLTYQIGLNYGIPVDTIFTIELA